MTLGPIELFLIGVAIAAAGGELFVRGTVRSLGADCIEKPIGPEERAILGHLLKRAGLAGEVAAGAFRLYGSARRLYQFHTDHVDAY